MTARKLSPRRPCACGCGQQVLSKFAQRLPECQRRHKASLRLETKSLPGRPTKACRRLPGESRTPIKRCQVCFDLPERREPICKGCGRAHGKESVRA